MKKDKLPEKTLFPIIETHCHLDYLDDESIVDTIQTAWNVGVEKLLGFHAPGACHRGVQLNFWQFF